VSVPIVQLGEVANFVNGFAFKPEDWGSEGLPIIRIQDLTGTGSQTNRTLREIPDRYRVHTGDLLVSWSASLGVYRWAGSEALVNQHIFKVVPNLRKVDLDYLRYAIDASIHEMERFTHGSTMKHINRKEFLEHRIPLPALYEQRRITAILDNADALRGKRKRALDLLDSLTQSIFKVFYDRAASERTQWPVEALGELCTLVRGSSPDLKGTLGSLAVPFRA
jgi:type I restriction enzyme S subunit